jgi:hypothetical protein
MYRWNRGFGQVGAESGPGASPVAACGQCQAPPYDSAQHAFTASNCVPFPTPTQISEIHALVGQGFPLNESDPTPGEQWNGAPITAAQEWVWQHLALNQVQPDPITCIDRAMGTQAGTINVAGAITASQQVAPGVPSPGAVTPAVKLPSGTVISSSAPPGTPPIQSGSTQPAQTSTGFDLSSIPWWGWLAAAGVAFFAFQKA